MALIGSDFADYAMGAEWEAAEQDDRDRYIRLAIARLSSYGVKNDTELSGEQEAAVALFVRRLFESKGNIRGGDISNLVLRSLEVNRRAGPGPMGIVDFGTVTPPSPSGGGGEPVPSNRLIPVGGATGQALVKSQDADFEVDWETIDTAPDDRLIPDGGASGQVLKKSSGDDYAVEWAEDDTPAENRLIPAGGTSLQVLQRFGPDDYSVRWEAIPAGPPGPPGRGVPAGGTTGQVLKKRSSATGDTEWADDETGGGGGGTPVPPNRLIPSGGSTGQVITKTSGTDYAVEWRNNPDTRWPENRVLPSGGSSGQVLKKTGGGDYQVAWRDDNDTPTPENRLIPPGGADRYVLTKDSNSDYAVEWSQDPFSAVQATLTPRLMPPGGSDGQVLKKTSGSDYAVAWENESGGGTPTPTNRLIPTGGLSGQVLKKISGNDFAVDWEDDETEAPNGLPSGGTEGQTLIKSSGADFAAGWQDTASVSDSVSSFPGLIFTSGPNTTRTATFNINPSIRRVRDDLRRTIYVNCVVELSTSIRSATENTQDTQIRLRVTTGGVDETVTVPASRTTGQAGPRTRTTLKFEIQSGSQFVVEMSHVSGNSTVTPHEVHAVYALFPLDESRLVPLGGTAGQVLAKASNEDSATEWITSSGNVLTGSNFQEVNLNLRNIDAFGNLTNFNNATPDVAFSDIALGMYKIFFQSTSQFRDGEVPYSVVFEKLLFPPFNAESLRAQGFFFREETSPGTSVNNLDTNTFSGHSLNFSYGGAQYAQTLLSVFIGLEDQGDGNFDVVTLFRQDDETNNQRLNNWYRGNTQSYVRMKIARLT